MLFFIFVALKGGYAEKGIVLDGREDPVYLEADSAELWFEVFPDFGEKSDERTVVKVVYDAQNLYVLFKCYATEGITKRLGGDEDEVTLYLDPFYSRTTAYYFSVSISGEKYDGIIFDDGKRQDPSWDGIWYAKTKAGKGIWIAEIKIPFKSIRYKRDAEKWGIQFKRYIAKKRTTIVWKGYEQREGSMPVSKYGEIKGIMPESRGYAFEIYPVGIVRENLYEGEEEIVKRAGLDLSWGITSSLVMQATFYPDFAEIEADPYTVNLSKYETYYPEKRPFFVEGADIFKVSVPGIGEFYHPFQIFYTRRIGKKLPDGREVPIITGLKLTQKEKRYDFGFISVLTDSLEQEKRTFWTAGRYKKRMFKNSEIGIMEVSRHRGGSLSAVIEIDGVFRFHEGSNIVFQAAQSWDTTRGGGINTGGVIIGNKWRTYFSATYTDENFDFSKTGYMNIDRGEKKIMLATGPWLFFNQGSVRWFTPGFGVGISKDIFQVDYSRGICGWLSMGFRNGAGFSINLHRGWVNGEIYRGDTLWYGSWNVNMNYWTQGGRFNHGAWISHGYGYNYLRGWLAKRWMGSAWFYLNPFPRFSFHFSFDFTTEYTPEGRMCQNTLSINPRLSFTISPDAYINFYLQPVFIETFEDFSFYHLITGGLFAWEIKPKSWIYLAFTSIRERKDVEFTETERVVAFKIKWVFSF